MDKRFFTVQEANELIPFLTERLNGLRSIYQKLKTKYENYAPSLQEVMARGGMPVDLQYFNLASGVQNLSGEICSEGCVIKDLSSGLVDFPTIWEGREVFLCWKLGEEEVSFWHEQDAGFDGRQPIKIHP